MLPIENVILRHNIFVMFAIRSFNVTRNIYIQVSFWMKRYENFVGLTDVKASQARVVECEKRFIEMQEKRREAQINIAEIQKNIKVT